MATPFRLKRSAVPGKRPTLSDLQLGELGFNTYDAYLFATRDASGVGIGTTVTLLTPWTENFGAASIYYQNTVGIGTTNPTSKFTVQGDVLISGFSTVRSDLTVAGVTTTRHLNVIGFTTVVNQSITGVATIGGNLSVSGVSTFGGITTVTGTTLFSRQLNVAGVSTFNQVKIGFTTISAIANDNYNSTIVVGDDLYIYQDRSPGSTPYNTIHSNEYDLYLGTRGETGGNLIFTWLVGIHTGNDAFSNNSGWVSLGYGDDPYKLTTIGSGVTVSGTTFTNQLNVSGVSTLGTGVTITSGGNINAVSGVVTAAQFTTGVGAGITITTNTIFAPQLLIIDPSPAGVGTTSGVVQIKGDLYVDGTQFVVNSTTIELGDFNIGIATTVGTNALLDGAGLGIGSANIRKNLTYANGSDSLKSSENFDLASGKVYKINGTEVLSATQLTVANINAVGVSTLGTLAVAGVTTTRHLNVVGFTTVVNQSITGVATVGSNLSVAGVTTTQHLNVTGFTTVVNQSITGVATVGSNLSVAGVTTTQHLNVVGFTTVVNESVTGVATIGTLAVSGVTTTQHLNVVGFTTVVNQSITGVATIGTLAVSGVTTTQHLNVVGFTTVVNQLITGVATVGSNLAVAGVTTTQHLNVTGFTTVVNQSITGIATIGTLVVSGVTTTQHLNVVGFTTVVNQSITGVATIGTLAVSGVTTTQHLNVVGFTTVVNQSITGVATVGSNLAVAGVTTTQHLNVTGFTTVVNQSITGVLTVSNGIQGIGIQSGGSIITTGIITSINFVGAGNSFSYNAGTKTVDINIGGSQWTFVDPGSPTVSSIYRVNGNVGIGTTNPTSKLDVVGDIKVSGLSTFTGTVSFGTSAYFGDNDRAYFGDGNDLSIYHNGNDSIINDTGTGNLYIGGSNEVTITNASLNEIAGRFITNGAVELYYDNSKEFETTGYGATVFGVLESQGLNITGFTTVVNQSITGVATVGSNLSVAGVTTTQHLNVTGFTTVVNQSITGVATIGTLAVSGVTTTQHLNVTGFTTVVNQSITGVATVGTLNVSGIATFQNNVSIADSANLYIGTGNDLRIFHNGANSFIQDNGTGNLFIDASNTYYRAATHLIQNSSSSENLAVFTSNGSVALYYDNTKTFETTGYGATIFGILDTQGLNVIGIATVGSNLAVSGITTVGSNLAVAGVTTTQHLNVSGFTTVVNQSITGVATVGTLAVSGVTTTRHLNVVGFTTVVNQSITGVATAGTLAVSGVTTTQHLNVSGIATLNRVAITTEFNVYAPLSTFHNDVNINGNLSIGGTTVVLNAAQLQVKDKDIVLGVTTNALGNDVSKDSTANHGGIAIASTEGTPLIDINIVGIDTIPSTYKQIMWIAKDTLGAGTTDAWHFNYGVGIGSTQIPNGVRLAVGRVQVTDNTVSSENLSISGVATVGSNLTVAGVTSTRHLSVTGFTTTANQSITGVATIATLAVTGVTTTQHLNVIGIATVQSNLAVSGIATVGSNLAVSGVTTTRHLNVIGFTTVVNQSITGVATAGTLAVSGVTTTQHLNVSGVSTLGVSTFTGNVSFGSSAYFGDNDKVIFGDGGDLEIYHDGASSYISDTGVGNLKLNTNGAGVLILKNDSEYIAEFLTDNAVKLYYDNVKTFETTGYGATVFGILQSQGLQVNSGVSTVGFLTATNIWNAGITTSSRLTLNGANNTADGGGQLYLNGATGNRIDFNTNGIAAPTFTTRSAGTKIVLYPNVSATLVDFALGIEGNTLWYSIDQAVNTKQHRFYAGTTQLADLKGSGELVIGSTSLTGTSSQRLQVTGGAYVSSSLGIGFTNPSAALHVSGQTFVSTGGKSGNNTYLSLQSTDASNKMELQFGNLTNSAWQIQSVENGVAYRSLVLNPFGGNIGIGTTNPTQLLDVRGNVAVSGVTTTQHLNVSGIATIANLVVSGIITATSVASTYAIQGSVVSSSSTTAQIGIHSALPSTTYRSVEYMIQAAQPTNFHTTKILVVHNGTTAYLTEYGSIYNSSVLADYDVDISGGNIRLLSTPASAGITTYTISFTATRV
jgi:hypothetical protein